MRLRLLPTGLLAVTVVAAPAALAADRHVYLDVNGNGQLNDCPNPAHNARGTSNTDELAYCAGGGQAGKVIGQAPGRITASSCTSAGGAVSPVTNGVRADVDGDGTTEFVYGHPQACVYNMTKSDSCEVHAGLYSRAGAECAENCGAVSVGGGSALSCDMYDCWFASVVAFGYGPNLDGTGYGTASSPGYLRGALMNGSIDSWDSDGDKIPDTEPGEPPSYPAVLSGDRNGNGVFDTTTCSGGHGNCAGDAFYMVQVGCGGSGGGSYGSILCRGTSFAANEDGPFVDTNADGTFDTEIGNASASPIRSTDYLVIRDLEFRRYNGGSGTSDNGSARYLDASLTLNGDGAAEGLRLDHLYIHDNDYAVATGETHWAHIGQHQNMGCADYVEVKNSFIVQTNEKIYVSDLQANVDGDPSTCPLYFHDNRVLVDVTSPRARTNGAVNLFYVKPVHKQPSGRESVQRFWNNEFILKNAKNGFFFDLQGFGTVAGLGEIWMYGNLIREHSSLGSNFNLSLSGFCGAGTAAWTFKLFNNTYDLGKGFGEICGSDGLQLVQKNNAFFRVQNVHAAGATSIVRQNEFCSVSGQSGCTTPSGITRSAWFQTTSLLDTFGGLAGYMPNVTGPLAGISTGNACDPDGDGTAGVDYNGDGVNDTSWLDISGSPVDCSSLTSPINIGALQSAAAPGSPPNPPVLTISAVTTLGATLIGGPFTDPDLGDTQSGSQFQIDVQTGSYASPAADSGVLNGAVALWTTTALVPGTGYKSRARYRDSTGRWSAWSVDALFTTLQDTTPPGAVTNLRRSDTE